MNDLLYAMISLLIEKKMITGDEIENKRKIIFDLFKQYSTLISKEKLDDENEKKLLEQLDLITKKMNGECHFAIDSSSEINKKIREANLEFVQQEQGQ